MFSIVSITKIGQQNQYITYKNQNHDLTKIKRTIYKSKHISKTQNNHEHADNEKYGRNNRSIYFLGYVGCVVCS